MGRGASIFASRCSSDEKHATQLQKCAVYTCTAVCVGLRKTQTIPSLAQSQGSKNYPRLTNNMAVCDVRGLTVSPGPRLQDGAPCFLCVFCLVLKEPWQCTHSRDPREAARRAVGALVVYACSCGGASGVSGDDKLYIYMVRYIFLYIVLVQK